MKLVVLTFGAGMVGGLLALAHDQDGWRGDDSRPPTDSAASRTVGPVHLPSPLVRGHNGHGNPVKVDTAAFETVAVDPGMPIRIEHTLDPRPILPASSLPPAR